MTKGLEELEKLGNIVLDKIQDENYGEITFRIKHLYSKSYEIIEKELKALGIIKRKRIDIDCLLDDGLETYNYYMPKERIVQQEEFDLLKEVFENE